MVEDEHAQFHKIATPVVRMKDSFFYDIIHFSQKQHVTRLFFFVNMTYSYHLVIIVSRFDIQVARWPFSDQDCWHAALPGFES